MPETYFEVATSALLYLLGNKQDVVDCLTGI